MFCPVCEDKTGQMAFMKDSYRILHCPECGHSYTELVVGEEEIGRIYSDDYFYGGKAGYPDYTLEKDILIRRGEYYARKVRKYMSPGKLLDVGAAAGFILKGFENNGWKGTGIEPNSTMAEYGQKVMELDIRRGSLEALRAEENYDLILMIQVVAHLYDLNRALRKIHQSLKPGGMILIETWNRASYTARFFGENWHEYSPPSTLHFFSTKSLDLLLKKHGFRHVRSGRPLKMVHSLHAKELLKHKMEQTFLLKYFTFLTGLIPGNMALPYPAEDLFWTIYEKN